MIEIQIRRATSSYLASQNPVLASGEPCLETDTGKVKYGDGITPWNLLDYSSGNTDISFGTNNDATGTDAFVAGGSDNLASGSKSAVMGGQSNTASGASSAVLGGDTNEASSENSVVVGGSENVSSGANSVVLGGTGNKAEGDNSVAMGRQARTDKDSQLAISSGMFETEGDAQTCIYNLRASTQNATPARMYINGTSGNLTLSPGASWSFEARVAAYDGNANLSGAWSIRGGIGRDFSGNVELSNEPTMTAWSTGWDEGAGPVVTADSATNSLAITVTGSAGRSIRWAATVTTTEVISEEPLVSDMFVELSAEAEVTSLEVDAGYGNILTPAFSQSISDYVIYSSRGFYDTDVDSYDVTINGGSPEQVSASVNKAIRIRYGSQNYFVRVLPSDFPNLPDIQTKTQDYVPGYYLVAYRGVAPYFGVLDSNGVPVWYTHTDEANSACQDEPTPISLHAGWESNRLMTNNSTGDCNRWDIQIGLNTLTAKPYNMINPDSRGTSYVWEAHESHAIKSPVSRKGNVIYEAYGSTGFYIQEQNPQNQIVWEWWSDDYFDTSYSEQFHTNSIDVHPVTGDVLVSCRHMGAVFAIDYQTKDIIWIIQGDGYCYGSGPMTDYIKPSVSSGIHILTPYNEPTVQGYSQYNGTDSQHDARWHTDIDPITSGNEIISISDNQTCNSRAARGVVYEIDLANDRAIFRTHAYSPYGSTGCCGSFTMFQELSGVFSGMLCLTDQNPNVVEIVGDSSGNFSQNVVFEMYTWQPPGAGSYRIIKVRPDFLNINYMRTTAGRIPTII